jgi:hypothetical protein
VIVAWLLSFYLDRLSSRSCWRQSGRQALAARQGSAVEWLGK